LLEVSEDGDLTDRIFAQAERPPDSSEVGNEVKPLMSEEERLAEEQSRRRLEELTRVSARNAVFFGNR